MKDGVPELGDRVAWSKKDDPASGRRGTVSGWHDDKHVAVKWDDGEERCVWVGFLRTLPKLGEKAACQDCGAEGVVVCTINADVDDDFDAALARMVKVPLEPSAYQPGGLTCRLCETRRLKSALPPRGLCANCGRPNASAMRKDLGSTRSFCDDRCINEFLKTRLEDERGD